MKMKLTIKEKKELDQIEKNKLTIKFFDRNYIDSFFVREDIKEALGNTLHKELYQQMQVDIGEDNYWWKAPGFKIIEDRIVGFNQVTEMEVLGFDLKLQVEYQRCYVDDVFIKDFVDAEINYLIAAPEHQNLILMDILLDLDNNYPIVLANLNKKMVKHRNKLYGAEVILAISKFSVTGVSFEEVNKIFASSSVSLVLL